jgi:hypothetical protein
LLRLVTAVCCFRHSAVVKGGVVGIERSGGEPATDCSKQSESGGVWWRVRQLLQLKAADKEERTRGMLDGKIARSKERMGVLMGLYGA